VTASPDRRLKKASLKASYLREELYDMEEEFDRRGWELQRAVIEILARSGELHSRAESAKTTSSQNSEQDASQDEAAPAWQKNYIERYHHEPIQTLL